MNNEEQHILQKHLSEFLVYDVFNTITSDDILKVKAPNVWLHKGKQLTEGQIKALRSEAKALIDSGLWQILKSELEWLSYETGFVKSQTESDQIAAKLLKYLVDTIESKLKTMSVE